MRHIIGHLGEDFYKPDDQTNSVKALKETSWSSRSDLNPIRIESNVDRQTFLTDFEIFRRHFDGVIIYSFSSDFKFFNFQSLFSMLVVFSL